MMADTTERTLRLLSLLQRRRDWPGPELARELEVSDRTLRRDIERLRELGYAIGADRGSDGGYRLGTSRGGAMLLLDGDEAVALAVALNATANGANPLAEATLGALTKVLSMLGPAQRRRAEKVTAATATGPTVEHAQPHMSVLERVAAACRDHVRLSFDYLAADGTETARYVEPCQLVNLGARWYLVAYDADRSDWRTFRLDRMTDPMPSKTPLAPRKPPAKNLSDYVRHNMSELRTRYRVVVDIDAPASQIRDLYGTWVTVEELADARCRMTMDTDTFRWPTYILANLDAACAVIGPPEFRRYLTNTATRLRRSSRSFH